MSPLSIVLIGYVIAVPIETLVLWFALSPVHPRRVKIAAGFWLTACTYPIIILVLPALIDPRASFGLYLAVAETFAPLSESALFLAAFGQRGARIRDIGAIVLANLTSFGAGEAIRRAGWLTG
jgi:hypothetical protein